MAWGWGLEGVGVAAQAVSASCHPRGPGGQTGRGAQPAPARRRAAPSFPHPRPHVPSPGWRCWWQGWGDAARTTGQHTAVSRAPPPQGGRMEEPPGPGREGAAVPRAWAACRLAGTHPVKTRHSSVQKRMSTWLNMADCVRRMARWKSFCGRGHRWRQRRGRDGAQSPSRRHVPDWCA